MFVIKNMLLLIEQFVAKNVCYSKKKNYKKHKNFLSISTNTTKSYGGSKLCFIC